ncbi:5-oxoprolinase-like [Clavelina lepadiformis]|uniref:Hydantoinase B/oxoprolinase domain-containing protein n=1 Tax=Clavelina lepadiformis TaxID=159417 RepID=A0ABP0G8Z6_CLALP
MVVLFPNAPHIPGHLGAMLDGVQYQMWAIEINEGDCIVSNHPCAGGGHLPVYSQVTAFLTLPGEFTSCSRTHNLHGNLADLRALVAANQKGIHLVQELISRSATFDFEGTSPMVINKLNAPRAISKSVIIYSLRCMVGYDIPLNQLTRAASPLFPSAYPSGPYSTPTIRYPDIRSSSRTSMQPLHWRRRGFEEDSLLKQLNAVSVVY